MQPLAAKNPGCQQVETQLDAGSQESTHNPLADAVLLDPGDRYRQFCDLLTRVAAAGPEPVEIEIDRIREHVNFTESEREVVAKIFRLGFEAALKKADQHKSWAYQRLLRRLLVGQPLDCPILGDNPYATLNRPKLPHPIHEVEGHRLKIVFASEEGDAANVAIPPTAEPSSRPWVSRRRRVAYALAINVLAVGLWLGPLTPKPADRVSESRSISKIEVSPTLSGSSVMAVHEGAGLETAMTNATVVQEPAANERRFQAAAPVEIKTAAAASLTKTAGPGAGAVFQAVQEIGLRHEPQHSAPKGDALPPGTRLEVIAAEGRWLKVRCQGDGKIGYVRKEFVEPISPET